MIRLSCLAVLLSWSMLLPAQTFSGGFKSGLNFSTFNGPSEMDADGNELEDFKTNTGFHIGATFRVAFTDYFGVRAELLYSQKGVDYIYEGPSYWTFTNTTNPVYTVGNRVSTISINNSYIDVPLMAYVRLGRIELSGGVNASILLGSSGTGDLTYSGTTNGGASVGPFTLALDYNYFGDRYQGFNTFENHQFSVGNTTLEVPKNIGAYYAGADSEEHLFRRTDFGLNAGISFFLNKGLYLGFRANMGMTDVTKMAQDYSRFKLDTDNSLILRDDDDKNLSFQASIGFSL
ncbi:porin family protein [Flavilitoribacter nigricans]|uniref:Outer membrane protein beta-barrel domain-containing protein n=1 Tax=Flavilitoribacter nigricans (strain ATCC 23147 / DSM 23189 / NBRC 102662 / NCIMB 1420 / SS-2) TaxID=1122177 RepID=A0A2D0NAS8_FLAN2|nr:porin family protein [Flavilitoribacter nigricans]PHN05614.1 hypothetical protein CRP01_16640 [Flavilitoribacter nigricans DSM 23189 = NBRC 102662]